MVTVVRGSGSETVSLLRIPSKPSEEQVQKKNPILKGKIKMADRAGRGGSRL